MNYSKIMQLISMNIINKRDIGYVDRNYFATFVNKEKWECCLDITLDMYSVYTIIFICIYV